MERTDKVRYEQIDLKLIDLNAGQISGLPRNPRYWAYEDMKKLQSSIEETPKLFSIRGLIVYPYEERYVVIGGNMRCSAAKEMGLETAPCVVLSEDLSIDKLKEIALKDNGSFGEWDEKLLKADWDESRFADWGINVFEVENEEVEDVKENTVEDTLKTFAVTFESEEFMFVKERLSFINSVTEQALLELFDYNKR